MRHLRPAPGHLSLVQSLPAARGEAPPVGLPEEVAAAANWLPPAVSASAAGGYAAAEAFAAGRLRTSEAARPRPIPAATLAKRSACPRLLLCWWRRRWRRRRRRQWLCRCWRWVPLRQARWQSRNREGRASNHQRLRARECRCRGGRHGPQETASSSAGGAAGTVRPSRSSAACRTPHTG